MMRGDMEYNAAQVKQGAAIISSHAGEKLIMLFEKGGNLKPSVARDEIWTDWDAFKKIADQLAVLSNGLEAASGNGLMMEGASKGSTMGTGASTMMGTGKSGMMTGSGMMGGDAKLPSAEMLAGMPTDAVFNLVTQTCSSCHTKFRIEKK